MFGSVDTQTVAFGSDQATSFLNQVMATDIAQFAASEVSLQAGGGKQREAGQGLA